MSNSAHDRALPTANFGLALQMRSRPGGSSPARRSVSYCCVATGTMAPDTVIGVSGSSMICMKPPARTSQDAITESYRMPARSAPKRLALAQALGRAVVLVSDS